MRELAVDGGRTIPLDPAEMPRTWRERGTQYPRDPAAHNTPRGTEPSREAVPGRVTCTVQRPAVLDPPKGNARMAGLWAAGHVECPSRRRRRRRCAFPSVASWPAYPSSSGWGAGFGFCGLRARARARPRARPPSRHELPRQSTSTILRLSYLAAPRNDTDCATTSASRKRRLCPNRGTSTRRAPGHAWTMAAASCQGTSGSSG